MNFPTMTPGHVSRRRVFPETKMYARCEITMDLVDGTWVVTVNKGHGVEQYSVECVTEAGALGAYNAMCVTMEKCQARYAN